MSHYLFDQLRFARENTLQLVHDVSEERLESIPQGFSNSLKWNLGHIYTVHHKFAFQLTQELEVTPQIELALFATGTSPATWSEQTIPSTSELEQVLRAQLDITEERLSMKLEDTIPVYTTSTGLRLETVAQLLSFCLYHEAMHFATMKALKRLV